MYDRGEAVCSVDCAETVEDALNQRWTSRLEKRVDSKHGSTVSCLSLKSGNSRFQPPCFSREHPDTRLFSENIRAPQQERNMLKDFELKSEGLLTCLTELRDESDQTYSSDDEDDLLRDTERHQEHGLSLELSAVVPLELLQRQLKSSLKHLYQPQSQSSVKHLYQPLSEGLCLTSVSDLFRASVSMRTVLTTGAAGVGKSVLVQRTIVDWCEDRALQHIQLLCPLSVPQQQSWTLMELLQSLCPGLSQWSLSELCHLRLLFILDGLDEWRLPLDFSTNNKHCDPEAPASLDVLLTNLMLGNLLPEAQLWIICRPAAARSIPPKLIHRVTEVRGFDDPQKEAYFLHKLQDEDQARTVLATIRSSAALHSMCHLPLFCSTTASAWAVQSSSITQLFLHFLSYHMMNMRLRYGLQRCRVSTVIHCLSCVAHEQLQRGELQFWDHHVRAFGLTLTEAVLYSGLCTEVSTHWAFSFLHVSLQEFLAALFVHLSNCGDDEKLHGALGDHPLFLHFLQELSLDSSVSLLRHMDLQRSQTTDRLKKSSHKRLVPVPSPDKWRGLCQ